MRTNEKRWLDDKTKLTKDFAIRLDKALKEKHMTQTELAEKTAIIEVSTINHYIRGDYAPTAYNLMLICKALEIEADWLLGLMD